MARHGSITSEHEDVIANDLVVVLCEVARIAAFVMTIRHLTISLHGKVTTKTAGHPGRVAGETGHVFIAMGKGLVVRWNVTPGCIVLLNRLSIARLFIVVASARCDRIDGLYNAPPAAWFDHRILNDVAGL